jgi:hypothetical protein
MMAKTGLPELAIDAQLAFNIEAASRSYVTLEEAERAALDGSLACSLAREAAWRTFCDYTQEALRRCGYLVVRGLAADGGISHLIVSSALGHGFDTYGGGQIVKRFRMSPWTKELSHTTLAGDFHTDGNVSNEPPVATTMQCEVEDPGAPQYAEQRVAFLPAVLERLRTGDSRDRQTHAFLTSGHAAMAQERSHELWQGTLVQNESIRYHPQSLRIGTKRVNLSQLPDLEAIIAAVHAAAMDVSIGFHTAPGDTLFVSNRTALHYRGECSVRFTRFPSEFESRSLLVLHLKN